MPMLDWNTVVFDFGVPLPMLDIDEVSAELPIEVVPIYRIEPLIADLLKPELAGPSSKTLRYLDLRRTELGSVQRA